MGFINRASSKHRSQADPKKLFVGRVEEVKFFVEKILKAEEPSHNIVSISGQGGIGKTTLLERFIVETNEEDFKDYCLTALVNERQTTPLDVMEKIADQLEIKGTFEKALKKYKDALLRAGSDQEAARDVTMGLTPDTLGSVVKEMTPIPAVNLLAGEVTEVGGRLILDKLHQSRRREDHKKLENPIGDLPHKSTC